MLLSPVGGREAPGPPNQDLWIQSKVATVECAIEALDRDDVLPLLEGARIFT